jgi:hypothetical protein
MCDGDRVNGDDPGAAASGDPRLDALVHLQRAALEFIAAVRGVLDMAEDAVRAPGDLAAVVAETAGSFAAAAGWWPQRGRSDPEAGGPGDAAPRPARGVQHIRIS